MKYMSLETRIAGAIVGMTLGDSLGMPGELWPKSYIQNRLGFIDTFKDGPKDNEVACYFSAGQYTDDSAQALLFLDAICEYNTIPEPKILADKLLAWIDEVNGFEKNLLGVSSKAALLAHSKNEDYTQYTTKAETNGAAMRIAPVGCVVDGNDLEQMANAVAKVSKVTHSTDVTIAGASMVAQAVASAILGKNFDEILEDVYKIHDIALAMGTPTYSANSKARLQVAISLLSKCKTDEQVSQMIYDVIGTGVLSSEAVPAALAIAYYCQNPEKAAIMCANLGGDTDTIGAMACAICGAYTGIEGIRPEWVKVIEKANNIDFKEYTAKTLIAREKFKL